MAGNTKIDVKEIEYIDVDSMHLSEDRDQWRAHANTVMKFLP